ncbi:hypothetical protein [Sporosarcina sp. FSL W7-1283]|uniref:hypothetical protein n=1 Tax=Sporosarcina sp. FSL W7-1283 TaxID=2921560 RepID=UPI0030FC55B1
MGNGYLGSSKILTSAANQEIVPETPENWTSDRYSIYKLSFINKNNCSVKINGGSSIYLEANQGFESSKEDKAINSFVIVEEGIQYSFIGAY